MANNQIDLGAIYGLSGNPTERFMGNKSIEMGERIPSLEQIAENQMNGQNNMNNNNFTPTSAGNGNINDEDFDFLDDISIFSNGNTGENTNNTSANAVTQNSMLPATSLLGGSNGINNAMGTYNNDIFSVNSENMQLLNGFLRTQIGRLIEANFMAGANQIICLTGILLGVGSDFLLINERGTNNLTTCDFDTLKYVRIFYWLNQLAYNSIWNQVSLFGKGYLFVIYG